MVSNTLEAISGHLCPTGSQWVRKLEWQWLFLLFYFYKLYRVILSWIFSMIFAWLVNPHDAWKRKDAIWGLMIRQGWFSYPSAFVWARLKGKPFKQSRLLLSSYMLNLNRNSFHILPRWITTVESFFISKLGTKKILLFLLFYENSNSNWNCNCLFNLSDPLLCNFYFYV